jgi:hypothetical protein
MFELGKSNWSARSLGRHQPEIGCGVLGKVSGLGIVAVGRVRGEAYPDKKWKALLPIEWTRFSLERPLPVRVLKALGIDLPQWGFRGDMVRIDPRDGERIRRIFEANLYQ